MNPICNRSAKQDLVYTSGKPNPPKSKAIVGKLPVKKLQNLDPQKTMPSFYTTKSK